MTRRRLIIRRLLGRRHVRWLRARTVSGHVSALALAVIAGWLMLLTLGFAVVVSSRVDRVIDDALHVRAQAASATVQITPGGVVTARELGTDASLDSSIWVYRGTGAAAIAVNRPSARSDLQRIADRLARGQSPPQEVHDRRFYILPLRHDGRRVGSVVADIDTEPYETTRHAAVLGAVIVAGLVLAGAYPVLRFATARALRPVAVLTRQAAEAGVTDPTQRFGSAQGFAELDLLASTLDQLLDRVAAVLRHERRLPAELSHELRTPLARVSAEVQLLLETCRADQRPALMAVRDDSDSINTIIDTLLATARTDLGRTVGRAELAPILRSFAAPDARPRVSVAHTDLVVGVDADVVTRMLSPIVDNARRYARRDVLLGARRHGTEVHVTVANDGPRLQPDVSEQVFLPGYSRDVGRDVATHDGVAHQGTGLGLALARRLARAADGDVTVDPSCPDTTFVVALPAG